MILFSYWLFWLKNSCFSTNSCKGYYYIFNWPNFVDWLLLLLEISENMWFITVFYPVCGLINFKNYLSFAMKPFSYMTKKSGQKFNWWHKKYFSSFWSGFQLPEIVSNLTVRFQGNVNKRDLLFNKFISQLLSIREIEP